MHKKSSYQELEQRVEALEQELRNREKNEKRLAEAKQRYERLIDTIPCALYDYVRWPDGRTRFIYISSQCKSIFGLDPEEIIQNSDLLWNMVHSEDREHLKQKDWAANQAGQLFQSEVRIILSGGRMKWIQLVSMPGLQKFDSQAIWSGAIFDISERKQIEEQRNQLLFNLQHALAEIKTLRGIIPICSYCKKIRDDKGYWEQIESYIEAHSDAELSHGICPECAKKYYPDMKLYNDDD